MRKGTRTKVIFADGREKIFSSRKAASLALGINKNTIGLAMREHRPLRNSRLAGTYFENCEPFEKNKIIPKFSISSSPSDFPDFLKDLKLGESITCVPLLDEQGLDVSEFKLVEIVYFSIEKNCYFDIDMNEWVQVRPLTRDEKIKNLSNTLKSLFEKKKVIDNSYTDLLLKISLIKKDLKNLGVEI